jgi:hypothetical protein
MLNQVLDFLDKLDQNFPAQEEGIAIVIPQSLQLPVPVEHNAITL